ncbi:YybH family protein [Hyphococcus sp.]|uniref:YybH family protein n=1 Tax=Hyphococcus sp. TaxID=2038636 RepID=UPI002087656A|nr:MAG: hypothetical protein DHS20C04_01440 [Marinicaulis sp.]
MLRSLTSAIFALALMAQPAKAETGEFNSAEEQAIITRMEHLATDLPEKGWDAYADHFAQGYDIWVMASERITGRDAFMDAVRTWYESGNGASKTEVKLLSIDFLGDEYAYVRSHEKEWFFGPRADEGRKRFEGWFASVWKKESDGEWRVYRTSFTPVYNGE